LSGGGTIPSTYGLWVRNQGASGVTNAYGGFIDAQSGATNNWTMWANGGSVVLNGGGAIATNATTGFVYLPSCAGTPSGTPVAVTGAVAFVYDTTNNKIAIYNGAWKQTAALT